MCSSAKEEVWKKAQYLQREYVKTSGKSSSVDYKQIEPSISKALQYISVDIIHDSIQSIHHINKSSNRAINNFSRYKNCEILMKLKSGLKSLDPIDIGISEHP